MDMTAVSALQQGTWATFNIPIEKHELILRLAYQHIVDPNSKEILFREILSEFSQVTTCVAGLNKLKRLNTYEQIMKYKRDGSMHLFDMKVLRLVVDYLNTNPQQKELFSVNISRYSFPYVLELLNIIKGKESQIIIEITESEDIDISSYEEFVNVLANQGIQFALDDFNDKCMRKNREKILSVFPKPNIIKLRNPKKDEIGIFNNCLQLIKQHCSDTMLVIEVVETEEELNKLSRLIEAKFGVQGFLFHRRSSLA